MRRKFRLFIHSFITIVIATCLSVHTVAYASAAVEDNVTIKSIQLSIGTPLRSDEPQTLFDWLRKIWSGIFSIDTRLARIEDALNISTAQPTTCYTTKPYLKGYVLKISDETTAKSCNIAYDAENSYYAGTVNTSFGDTLTIDVVDAITNVVQCTFSVPMSESINLDPLVDAAYAYILNVNDTLATEIYKQSYYTRNISYLPTIFSKLVTHDEHLSDFMKSSAGVTVTSTGFEQLYGNEDEFVSCISSRVGLYFINNATVGKHIANTRDLLRCISTNSTAIKTCENSSTFCKYVRESTLPRKTKTMHGGEDNVVSGNLLVVYVESGSRGGYTAYAADMGGGLTHTGNFASARSNCTSLKGNTYSRFIQAGTTSGSTYTDASGTIYRCGTCDAAGANTSVTAVKFADKACVNQFGTSSVSCPVINRTYDTGSQVADKATADSVITYIDLN